jgi:hypothetical protein
MMFDCLLESHETGVAICVANNVTGKRISRSNDTDKKLVDIGVGLTGGMKHSSFHGRRKVSATHDTTKIHVFAQIQS